MRQRGVDRLKLPVLVVALAWTSVDSRAAETIGGYQLVSEVRVTRTVSELTFRAALTNTGAALAGATATATSLSADTSIVDGALDFGPVAPGGSVVSTDTFSLRHNRLVPFDWASIRWSIASQPANAPPVANAGPDRTAAVGGTIALDGSASSDPEGSPLTYAWTLLSQPAGSTATLSDATTVNPSLTIDVAGSYVVRLIVHDRVLASAPDTAIISTSNSRPVANAGPDQTKLVTATVTLDGSGSTDVDGDPLSFAWGFVSRPAGSAAVLSDATAVLPTFTVDVPGSYVVQVIVHDGLAPSTPDTVTISTLNSRPVADAGPNQTTTVGTVTLDGSGSSDVDGDALTYAWSFTSVPAGSTAVLSDPIAVMPSLVVDRGGTYVAQLVVHDGTVASLPDTVVITIRNSAPVADAGPHQTVLVGGLVLLDGSGSSDADGDPLSYSWALTVRPAGSSATLTGATSVAPSFVVDRPGTYVAQLVVDDGGSTSAPDTVTISTVNSAPIADAGPHQLGVPLGAPVVLSGAGSTDPDGDPLTFAWSFTSRPVGSAALLLDADTVSPTFTPDVAGDYVVQLIVGDGPLSSAPDTILVRINNPPLAAAGPDQSVATGATVLLDGSGSSDPDGDPLAYAWAFASTPMGSTAVLQNADTSAPTFVADQDGVYVVELTVTDGAGGTETDMVQITASSATPVVTVVATDVNASEVGLDPGSFTLTRTGSTAAPLAVTFSLGGSATEGADYASIGVSVTILAGLSSATVTLTPTNDALVEGAETAVLNLTDLASYDLGTPASATVTIADQPTPIVTLAALDPDASEVGPDNGSFRFSRVGDTSLVLSVTYAIGGSGTNGADYAGIASSIQFPAGQAIVDLSIQPVNDGLAEVAETVVLTLSDGEHYELGAGISATVTIADSPVPLVSLSVPDESASEVGPDPGVFRFTRTGVTTLPLSVTFSQGGTAANGTDYADIGTAIAIPAGQATLDLAVSPVTDSTPEGTESVTLALVASAEYDLGSPSGGSVNIADSSPVVTIVATDAEAGETGPDTGTFTVSRSGGTGDLSAPLAVSFSVGGTATAGLDYASLGSGVTIPAGQASTTLTVTPFADALAETLETIVVSLAAGPYFVAGGIATVTIADSTQPIVTIVATDSSASEVASDDGLFTITRTGDTTFALAVGFAIGGSASNGGDYTVISGGVLIPAGEPSATVLIDPTNDPEVEGTQTVVLTLSDDLQYDLGVPAEATVTIADQPTPVVTILATDPNASEVASDDGLFTITRTGDTTFALAVGFAIGGSASNGGDYTGISGGVLIPAGERSATVLIDPINDVEVEGPETVVLTLAPSPVYALGAPSVATVTIADQPTQILILPSPAEMPTRGALTMTAALNALAGPGGQLIELSTSNSIVGAPPSVLIPQGAMGAVFAVTSGISVGSTIVTGQAAGLTSGASTVFVRLREHSITSPLVGLGRTVTATIHLALPAPTGGAEFLMSVGDTAIAQVAPATVTVPQSSSQATFQISGQSTIGATTVTADGTAAGYGVRTLDITVTDRLIEVPPIPELALGDRFDFNLLIGPDPAPVGGAEITLTSSAPGVVEVLTPTVMIPAGSFGAPASIRAVPGGPGTAAADITASNAGFAPDTERARVTATLDILQTFSRFESSATDTLFIQLRSGGRPFVAPASVPITLASDDPSCVSVVSPIVVPSGGVIGTSALSYGGTASIPCTASISATSSVFGTDTVPVSIESAPRDLGNITVLSVSGTDSQVGSGLQAQYRVTLATAAHGGVTVQVRTSDFNLAQVGATASTPGLPIIELTIPNGQSSADFSLQAGRGALGTARVTASNARFNDGFRDVPVVPAVFQIINLSASQTTLSANQAFWARCGIRQPSNPTVFLAQAASAAGPLSVTFTSSAPLVGQLVTTTSTGGSVVAQIAVNGLTTPTSVAAGGVAFDPLSGGTTTVSATATGFDPTWAPSSVAVTVTQPGITVSPVSSSDAAIGSGLQAQHTALLGGTAHGGVTVRITSDNPSVALVSANATTAGVAFVDVFVADGASQASFWVQAVRGVTGTANITASQALFVSGTLARNVVPAVFQITNLSASQTTLSANQAFWARCGIRQPSNPTVFLAQAASAAGPLPVTFTSSAPLVGQLVTTTSTGGSVVAQIPVNGLTTPTSVAAGGVAFDPLSGGTTTVSATATGFDPTWAPSSVTVTVTQPGITVSPVSSSDAAIGSGLQAQHTALLGGTAHGGVTVRITSDNPSVALVSANATTAGVAFVDVFVADGASQASFWVQAVRGVTGTANITASQALFVSGTLARNVVPAVFQITNLSASQTTLSANQAFWARCGIRQPSNPTVFLAQAASAAGPLSVTFTSSAPLVGQLVTTTSTGGSVVAQIAVNGLTTPTSVAAGGVAFDPLSGGTTTVSATATGFDPTWAPSSVAVTVTQPGITVSPVSSSDAAIGSGLQAQHTALLGGTAHGGVTVRITSDNPSVALVSANATTAGVAFVDVFVADGASQASFWVQAERGVTGTANITASQALFVSGTLARNVVPAVFQITNLSASQTTLSANQAFWARCGIRQPSNPANFLAQAASAAGPLPVTFTSSAPLVGQLVTTTSTGGSVVAQIPVNGLTTPTSVAAGGVAFDPLSGGTTTVSATATGFDPTWAPSSVAVTVTQPGITVSPVSSSDAAIGSGLQAQHTALLGGTAHGGVTVRITSDNPSVALVSANATTAGVAFVDVFVADGASQASFWVQAVRGVTGTANITASQALFVSGTLARNVVPAVFQITNLSASQTTLSANQAFWARCGIRQPSNPANFLAQAASAAGPLPVTFTSSAPLVGQLVTTTSTGGSVVAQIAVNGLTTPTSVAAGGVAFDPLSGGTTTVSATATGFDPTWAPSSVAVTVTP